MKRTVYQNDEERSILIAAIVHDRVLARIASKVEKEPFRSKWSNLVFKWCLAHFNKYQKAPKKSIQAWFLRYAEKSQDESTVSTVEKFLEGLSEDYARLKEERSEDFLVDMAARYFNRVRCEKFKEKVEEALTRGDVEEAVKLSSSYTPVSLATTDMVDVFTDEQAWKDALAEDDSEVLVEYPRALGEFFGNNLHRDGFVAFLAPEKRGKSFWLIDVAWRAATTNKRKTIFYSVGDMSQRQMMRRFQARAAGRPYGVWKDVFKPTRIILREGGEPKLTGKRASFEKVLSIKQSAEAMKIVRMKTAHSISLLKLRCTPNSTTRIADIEADIEDRIREGWIPEVVVIDYADILAPERIMGEGDFRHQTDETWKAMRRLSQKYHMLVVTATQSNAASYEKAVLRRTHFSEDKRKLAHVTGMVGINQTEEEKLRGIFRLNWILLREGFYSESKCVTVAGCLAIANPAIVSAM